MDVVFKTYICSLSIHLHTFIFLWLSVGSGFLTLLPQ
ncbi:hypothetical protein Krac_4037 [Ktedonobacter racemifer DSM 44963]|uniref:Uncharacterized protein n=1 Tax=Ktedonobacter racemifer DSM 44963 TaxID=485913 RepID=D6TXR5_KTERA|nr:hypothetical protein Krac_4037 [Ktedonobacter racemifer DSM 44963]